MPDTLFSPGDPAVPRDMDRRPGEQGAGATRRKPPTEAAPPLAELVRARRTPYGLLARSERPGPRWRDIQWIDFASDADSPDSASATADFVKPSLALPPAPELGNVLRRFARSARPEPVVEHAAINGLAHRFARVPVRLEPAPLTVPSIPVGTLLAASLRRDRAGAHSQRPLPVAAAPAATAAVSPPAPVAMATSKRLTPAASAPPLHSITERALPAPPRATEDDRSFPASIFTPTSTIASEPDPARHVAATVAARLNRVGGAVRERSEAAAAAFAGGAGRARAVLRQARLRSGPATLAPTSEPQPAAKSELTLPRPPSPGSGAAEGRRPAAKAPQPTERQGFTGVVGRLSRRIAALEPRLQFTGLVVLTALIVALAAYVGGAFLAGLAGADGRVVPPRAAAVSDKPAHAPQSATVQPNKVPSNNALSGNVPADNTQSGNVQAARPAVVAAAAADPAPQPQPQPQPQPVPQLQTPPTEPAARAAYYLAKAKAGDPAAQYDVAVLYAHGDGLVQDYASAASWFHASAAQGNVAAEYNLGVLYAHGQGVETSATQALNWYRSAADQGSTAAQFNLALAYAEGHGAKQDYAAASRWYQRAAKHGSAPAMMNLAILYEQGQGVERSLVDAYAWYNAAGERGEAVAKERAAALFGEFDDREKARAEGLAATIGAALDSSVPPA